MLKVLGFIGLVFILLIVILLTSIRIRKGSDGKKVISVLWGAVKIDEGTKKVNVFGDFISVDGKKNSVKVAGIVDVDGDADMVNVDGGKILVDGKENLVKVDKSLVLEVKEDHVLLKNEFDSKLISTILHLKEKSDKELKVEGQKVGEDERYIHLKVKGDTNINVEVNI